MYIFIFLIYQSTRNRCLEFISFRIYALQHYFWSNTRFLFDIETAEQSYFRIIFEWFSEFCLLIIDSFQLHVYILRNAWIRKFLPKQKCDSSVYVAICLFIHYIDITVILRKKYDYVPLLWLSSLFMLIPNSWVIFDIQLFWLFYHLKYFLIQ